MYLCIDNVKKLYRADLTNDALFQACRYTSSGRCQYVVGVYDITDMLIDQFTIGAYFSNVSTSDCYQLTPAERKLLGEFKGDNVTITKYFTVECPCCPKYIRSDNLNNHVAEHPAQDQLAGIKNKIAIDEGAVKFWEKETPGATYITHLKARIVSLNNLMIRSLLTATEFYNDLV